MACQAKTIPSDARASFCLPVKFVDEDTRKHLYLNHLSVEGFAVAFCLPFHQPSIRPNHGHDSSIRSPNPMLGARALNQSCGRFLADQGHPRAALDANDLWICRVGAALQCVAGKTLHAGRDDHLNHIYRQGFWQFAGGDQAAGTLGGWHKARTGLERPIAYIAYTDKRHASGNYSGSGSIHWHRQAHDNSERAIKQPRGREF
jgi:hypothetical protein